MEINPGGGNANPTYLTVAGNTLFFAANDGTNGEEVWQTDGTMAGTVLVGNIRSGIGNSYPRYLTNVAGTLFFAATDGVNGFELWKLEPSKQGPSISVSTVVSVQENSTTVLTATASDPDPGTTLTYSLSGVDANFFSIGSSNGVLTFNTAPDFEAPADIGNDNVYNITVMVSNGTLSDSKAVTVTVTNVNEAPVSLVCPSVIAENSGPNAVLGTFSTTDPDAGDSFTYALAAGTGDGDNALFNIIGGQLRANANFDFETKSSYSIFVRATDLGGLSFESQFTITVTNVNEAPVSLVCPSVIAENSGPNAVLGTFSTTDPDAGDSFTYALVPGTGDGDNALFNISGGQLRANAAFDFETKSSYSIFVRATDLGGLSFEGQFTITVTNVNEAPVSLVCPSVIAENSGPNAVLGTFSTTDPDAGDSFTYALVPGTGDGDNALFNISGGQLRANANFDFETKSSYSVRVRATDLGGLSFESQFTITVTDDPNELTIGISPSTSFVVFREVSVTGVTVADPTAGSFRLTTVRTAPGGKVSLGARSGLQFLAGDGTGDSTMRFTGTVSQTAAALKSLSYLHSSISFSDTRIDISLQSKFSTVSKSIPLTAANGVTAKVADIGHPSSGRVSLVIHGTPGADTVVVTPLAGSTTNYRVTLNGVASTVTGVTGRLIVGGLGGDDNINLAAVGIAARVDGGDGNDVIQTGFGEDVLLGGNGADLLAGGLGADTVNGGAGSDIVIDGTVSARAAGKTLRSVFDGWAVLQNPSSAD